MEERMIRRIVPAVALALVFAFSALAQDKATESLTLVVNPGVVTVSTATVPNGNINQSYSTTIVASGGISPYTFSVASGTLPAGLSIAGSTGIISGSPTASGSFSFVIQAADSETPAVIGKSATLTMTVNDFVITTTSLSAANLGIAYTATLAATGGTTPYTWAVTTGSLPAGLTLNSSTGVISGTPTAAGSFTFTVTATDSATNVAAIRIKTKIEVAALLRKSNAS
jgi:large repetitive protein